MQAVNLRRAAQGAAFGIARPRLCLLRRPADFRRSVLKSLPKASALPVVAGGKPVKPEQDVPGMTVFLNGLKWDKSNLVAVIVQVNALL